MKSDRNQSFYRNRIKEAISQNAKYKYQMENDNCHCIKIIVQT